LVVTVLPTATSGPARPVEALATHLARAFPTLAVSLTAGAAVETIQRVLVGQVVPGLRAAAAPVPPAGLAPTEQVAWQAAADHGLPPPSDRLAPFFPARYTDLFAVATGDFEVTVRALGARPAAATTEAGAVVYRDAYPSVDSIHVVKVGRSEEFLHLRDRAAPARFGYVLTPGDPATTVELEAGGVRLTSATGRRLQIEAPWVVDATSQHRDDVVRWELGDAGADGARRLDLILEPTGLTYPLVIDPSWTNTTSTMATARTDHTATLLPDGRVLVVGGKDIAGNALATAEIYDPLLGTWSFTGAMSVASWNHTATLLPNGKVLVAGGFNGLLFQVSRAALYDPATGLWTTTGAMAAARERHTATLLGNGTVLVSGGRDQSEASLATTETYSPASGTWSSAGAMNATRQYHTATLLTDGRVLATGGLATTPNPGSVTTWLASAEIYNPNTRQWTVTGNLASARGRHSATLLPDGRVLVVGGQTGGAGGGQISGVSVTATTEFWAPASGTWSAPAQPGPLVTARQAHTATLLTNGGVLIVGGATGAGASLDTAELYPHNATGWTSSALPFLPASSITNARYGHAATLLATGQVLVTGGLHSCVNSPAFPCVSSPFFHGVIYDTAAGNWSAAGQFDGGAASARSEHTATLLADGRVFVAGGKAVNGTPLASTQMFDPATGLWTARQSMASARYGHTATLLPDGRVLVTGGLGDAVSLTDVALYDPVADEWRNSPIVPSMSAQRYGHTATLLRNGQVLVTGGNDSGAGYNKSAERYDPIANQWTPAGAMVDARFKHTATLMPNGTVLVAGGFNGIGTHIGKSESYNPTTNVWSNAGAGPSWEHTATLMPNGGVAYVGGRYATGLGGGVVRYGHTATVLTTGQVLVVGGKDSLAQSAEPMNAASLYEPGTNRVVLLPPLATARAYHTTTLLPDGTVLIAGGVGTGGTLSSSERFNVGLGHQETWRPALTGATSPLYLGSALTVTGTGFKGIGEGSGGNGGQQSATNTPVLRLQSLSNEQVTFLPLDPAIGWSDTHITSKIVTDYPIGHALVTIITNGIPSRSRVIVVLPPRTTTTTALTSSANPSAIGASVTFTATVNGPAGSPVLATGTIIYKDGSTTLATVPLTPAGSAQHAATLAPGAHSITAEYSGDTRFLPSTSAPLVQQVLALPTISAGGPYSVAERATTTLSATGTTAQGGTPTFAWDLDDDGVFEAPGQQVTFAAGAHDGPGSADVTVRGCDGSLCATASVSVAITNAAPVASFVAPAQVVVGDSIGLALTGVQDVPADLVGLEYAFDCGAGYGSFTAGASASCPTSELGTRTVRGKVRDKDGGEYEAMASVSIVLTLVITPTATATPTVTPTASPTAPATPPTPTTIGALAWYFAEGWTGPGFDEYLTIQNPNASAASVRITYYLTGSPPVVKTFSVAGNSRDTVTVHDDGRGVGRNGGKGWPVSAKVESINGVGIVVERPMYFRYGTGIDGGHNVMGVQEPRQAWYFAEGWTGTGFDEYLTVMNPNDQEVPVTIDYFLDNAPSIQKHTVVPRNSRYTVTVHGTSEGVGRDKAVSARVTTTHSGGIVVERPIYFQYVGSLGGVTGGHNVMGAAEPQAAWYFPDGNTTTGYDQYLTLMNTTNERSDVRLTYYTGANPPPTRTIAVPANSRRTVNVHEATDGVGRGLRLGTKVETTNGVSLVVERPLYFRYHATVDGGHDIMGAPQPAPTWLFAEGYTGTGFDEELVILNPGAVPADVTITYYRGPGKGPLTRQLTVGAYSRRAVQVHDLSLGVGRDEAVSAKVESTNVDIVVERPMYFRYVAAFTANGGHTVMGYVP
jgi:hypothetical protein